MHTLGGWWKSSGETRRIKKKKKIQKTSDSLELEIWYYKGKQVTGEPVAQNSKAWRQPFAHEASSSVDTESQKVTEATWGPLSPQIAGHIALCGSRLLHGQENLWKTNWRSSRSPSSQTRWWTELQRKCC